MLIDDIELSACDESVVDSCDDESCDDEEMNESFTVDLTAFKKLSVSIATVAEESDDSSDDEDVV